MAVTIPTTIFGVPVNPSAVVFVTIHNDVIDTVSITSFTDAPTERIIEVPLVAVYSAEDKREPFRYTSIYPGAYSTVNVVCPSVAVKLLVVLCDPETPVRDDPSP